jgi:hypothetical protein
MSGDLTIDESGALYGTVFEGRNGVVLHPDDVTIMTDSAGNILGYLWDPKDRGKEQ